MANYIEPVLGSQIMILVADPETPTVFAHPNIINTTRAISLSNDLEVDELVDLEDQSAPAAKYRRVRSTDCSINGSGMMSAGDTYVWMNYTTKGTRLRVKVTDGNWMGEGIFIVEKLDLTAERTKPGENTVALVQGEPITWTKVVTP